MIHYSSGRVTILAVIEATWLTFLLLGVLVFHDPRVWVTFLTFLPITFVLYAIFNWDSDYPSQYADPEHP